MARFYSLYPHPPIEAFVSFLLYFFTHFHLNFPIFIRLPSLRLLPSPRRSMTFPILVDQMLNSKGEKSAAATKRIYELCDVGHKQNRVPMVCSGKYDVLTPLAKCLTQESGDGRHLACLALNNLSIPTENKRVMALGPASKDVIGGLCKVIAEDKQESYLCCICLMNLSFLEASITSILQHSPDPKDSGIPPLDNPDSLLRVLEKLLTNSPAVPKSGSGKSEGVRWACGLIKNLAKSEENAAMIGKTDIPKCVVENIRATTAPPSRWTSNCSRISPFLSSSTSPSGPSAVMLSSTLVPSKSSSPSWPKVTSRD